MKYETQVCVFTVVEGIELVFYDDTVFIDGNEGAAAWDDGDLLFVPNPVLFCGGKGEVFSFSQVREYEGDGLSFGFRYVKNLAVYCEAYQCLPPH